MQEKKHFNFELENEILNLKQRYIYCFKFNINNKKYVYIGLTYNPEERYYSHFGNKKCSLGHFVFNNNLPTPKFEDMIILEKNLNENQAQIKEREYIEDFLKNGYYIINIAKAGSLGRIRKYNFSKEEILAEAKKYKCMRDFIMYSNTYYKRAKEINIVDDISKILCISKKNGYWLNKEHIFNFAKKCKTYKEFNQSSASRGASKLGIRKEIRNLFSCNTEKGYWLNEENILNFVKKCKTYKEFRKNYSAYYNSNKLGILNQIKKILPPERKGY